MKSYSSKLTQTNFRISKELTTASETWAQNTITQKVTLHRVVGIHSKEKCFLLVSANDSEHRAEEDIKFFTYTGLTYCFYMWCIFDNPDPIFTLQLVSLRKSWKYWNKLFVVIVFKSFILFSRKYVTTVIISWIYICFIL